MQLILRNSLSTVQITCCLNRNIYANAEIQNSMKKRHIEERRSMCYDGLKTSYKKLIIDKHFLVTLNYVIYDNKES